MTVQDASVSAYFVRSLAALRTRLWPTLTNWSRTSRSTPPALFLPSSVDEVKAVLTQASEYNVRVRVLGARYCMNALWSVDPGSYALSLENMKGIEFTVDAASGIATIPGQLTIGVINDRLAQHDLTLPSMGSVSGPTIAGCISTCTHGTGTAHSTISSYVTALTLVLPPTPAHPARALTVGTHSAPGTAEHALFHASLCGLGCTGVIVAVAIRCAPLRLLTERTHPLGRFADAHIAQLEALAHSGERVRLWWNPATGGLVRSAAHSIDTLAEAEVGAPAPWWRTRLMGCYLHQALLFLCSLHPVLWRMHPPALRLLTYLSHHGIAHARTGLPGKVQEMDCLYSQRTTEYSIPGFPRAQAVLRELKAWIEGPGGPREMNGMIEIRFARADAIPLSPVFSTDEDALFVDLGLVQYVPFIGTGTTGRLPYEGISREFERICKKYGGRVHWAKECSAEPRGIMAVEEAWGPGNDVGKWAEAVREVDPKGIFWNRWLEERLGGVH